MAGFLDNARIRSGTMMEALGIDPEILRMRGLLRDQELSRIASRCAGCADVSVCEGWLANHPICPTETPDFCRNKFLFDIFIE